MTTTPASSTGPARSLLGAYWATAAIGQLYRRYDDCALAVGASRSVRTRASEQFSLDGIHDRFQTIVSSQLLVDVMEVIPESLRADVENVSNLITILALCEPAEDVFFLVGQWGYWRCPHGRFADRTELLG